MVRLSAAATSLLDEIVDIALIPGSHTDRAQALLTPLRRVAPCDAAFITAFDPERREQTALMRYGYTPSVNRALDGPQLTADMERAGLQGASPPMRVTDLPVPVETLPTWSQHLYPAGIRQALSVGLFTTDGRYLGVLNLNSADPTPASDESCEVLARAMPWIARAIDPLRTLGAITGIVRDAAAGVVLTRGGNTVALAGLPGHHPLLTAGSPLLGVAGECVSGGQSLTTFLCPVDGPDPGLVRVSVLACPEQPPAHLSAVVLLSPPPFLSGLTVRDLEILGLLVAGWSRIRMAAALGKSVRAVVGEIEDVLTRVGAPSRHEAAVKALRRGLYIPADLTDTPRAVQQ